MISFGMSQLIDRATGQLMPGLIIPPSDFSFVQISDSHIGFNKAANTDVLGTLQAAIAKINAMQAQPSFVLHTGDLTQLAQPDEFDVLEQTLKSVKTERIFYVPGEHDVTDNGKLYMQRFGSRTQGDGWYSFDSHGVHFVGLVNVMTQGDGSFGVLGNDQLQWLEKDLKPISSSTPIVVFAHVPLWAVYPAWGWGTKDSEQALSYLRRFGSVSVLNGHIHQTIQKVEGNITFHTAMSTAFPQPAPGTAPSAGPMKVPAETLRNMLGLTSVHYIEHNHTLAITDTPLMEAPVNSK
jgi:3',5'-cyclic AMP phosphodiesterase CpdA